MTSSIETHRIALITGGSRGLGRSMALHLADQGTDVIVTYLSNQREADEVSGEGGNQTDLMILTHDTKEGAMNKALTAMQALPTVLAPIVKLRKEELA